MQLRMISTIVRMSTHIIQRLLLGKHDYIPDKIKQIESERVQEREREQSIHLDNLFEQSFPVCSCDDREWKGGYCARSSGAYDAQTTKP